MCAVCDDCKVGGIGRARACGVVLVPYEHTPSDFAHLAACLELSYTCSLLISSSERDAEHDVEQKLARQKRIDATSPVNHKCRIGHKTVTQCQIWRGATCRHARLSICTRCQTMKMRLPDKLRADRETNGHRESGVPAVSRHDRPSIPRLFSLAIDVFILIIVRWRKHCESAGACCG